MKNIERNGRVRVRTHGRSRTRIATPLPEDDPVARQGALGLGAKAFFLRLVGTTLLTVRITLEPAPGTTGSTT